MRQAREASRRPQPRQEDRCQATTATGCRKRGQRAQHATNHGTRTGARQHQPAFRRTCARPAANPAPAAYGTATVRMDECATGSVSSPCRLRNSRLPDGRVQAGRVHSPCRLRQAAVRIEVYAPCSDAPHPQHSTPSVRTGEREPSGQGHRTRNTTQRAGTPVNRSQVAKDTAQTAQLTERAH